MDPCLQLRSVKVNWALEVWKNNATLSLFADPVIAGVQFSFQLFYQQLTEADRNHFDPNSFCLRCGNLAEERGLEFQRSKWHQYNFAFRVFSLFSFSQVPLNGFLGLFCTWVSLNIWPPTGLKDLIGFFFLCVCVTEARPIIFPLRLCFIREWTHPSAIGDRVPHRASPSLIQRWSERGASDQSATTMCEPLFKTHSGKPWPSRDNVRDTLLINAD